MVPDPEANTLGQKRKLYNEFVKASYNGGTPAITPAIQGDDLEKMMKIDIACKKKDVNFVINALTDEDILYVSRTIKQSTWIITEPEHATLINPEYLNTQLFPKMTNNAIHKLLKHIRLHLQDNERAEAFYNDESDVKKALKWLPNCSLSFIEEKCKKHASDISVNLFKRLCEISTSIFEIVIKNSDNMRCDRLKATLFVLYKDVDKYLNVIDTLERYEIPKFGVKGTLAVMKASPERIVNNIKTYIFCVDEQTFAKTLKNDEIKEILYKLAEINHECPLYELQYLIKYNLRNFIRCMPKDIRFDFVKAVFIDKVHQNPSNEVYGDEEIKKMAKLYKIIISRRDNVKLRYNWYEFAPFEVAFPKLKDFIRDESNFDTKYNMLNVLAVSAGSNLLHLQELLQYYHDKHINDKTEQKHEFITDIISRLNIHVYEEKFWNILNNIFTSMDIYKESNENVKYVECIIIYNILNNNQIPKTIENRFIFNTLKSHGYKMKDDNKDKIFQYLFNYLMTKLKGNAENEADFKEKIDLLYNILLTLKDWKKEINKYPTVLDKIREFIKIKKENSWKTDLSKLYNVNKPWKKHMFEESLSLNASEEVCLNALKHDPELMSRYNDDVEALMCNNKVSLNRLLKKLRIFWSLTLAKDWENKYIGKLDQTNEHKAIVRALCTILPKDQFLEIIQKYSPDESKINWSQVDGNLVSLQRNIAKNMHLARPHPTPDAVLNYAKGDYLQYSLPSLHAMFLNLSVTKSREYLPKLLDSPVSLQKHGIRFAVIKLQPEEIKNYYLNIWNSSKNVTIRAIIFKFTYDILCKEKDSLRIKEFWDVLSIFIDNLSFKEDKKIYELLGEVEKVPLSVRPEYIVKSYNFLLKYIPEAGNEKQNFESMKYNILDKARDIIEHISPEFIIEVLLDFIPKFEQEISYTENVMFRIIPAFVLSCKDENIQTERYTKLLVPLLECSFKSWEKEIVRRNFISCINYLRSDLGEYVKKDMIIPVKMYSDFQKEMEKVFKIPENYLILTEWKLTTAFANILNKIERSDWDSMCTKVAPEFGKVCSNYLKEDTEAHFSLIYELFSQALGTTLDQLVDENVKNLIFKGMLTDENFIPAYLALLEHCSQHRFKEVTSIISKHPAVEVKMHYYNKIGNFGDNDIIILR